ncbi:MAG: hypothetical protein ABWY13_07195 [Mesorhizobium sp.]
MRSIEPVPTPPTSTRGRSFAKRESDIADGLLSWNILFAGLAVIGFANGMSHRAMAALRDDPGQALLLTFDVSAIVWVALIAAVGFLLRPPRRSASKRDGLVAILAIAVFLAPAPQLSWLALSGLGLYVATTSQPGAFHRSAGWILLAVTVPMFWSRVVFSLMSDAILRFDAMLVSLVLGTGRVGNTISFADGWGYFWVAPACSSIANVSLALLCWVLITQMLGTGRTANFRFCLMAACAVIVINVGRLSLIGISRDHFELIHGPVGSLITGWVTVAVIFAICLYGATSGAKHAARSSY